jgi:hypothetical protein
MCNLNKRIKTAFLIIGIALAVMCGTTQSKAAYYDNYYSFFQSYINAYNSTGNAYYLYTGYAFYYYYLAGLYGDYDGYYYDPYGNKSDRHIGNYYSSFTYNDIYFNYYAFYGDYYYRIYNSVATR